MALSYRDVYIVLRARDEASRTIGRMGRNVGRMGRTINQVNAAVAGSQLKMQRDAEVAQKDFENRTLRAQEVMNRSISRTSQTTTAQVQKMSQNIARQTDYIANRYTQKIEGANAAIAKSDQALARNRAAIERVQGAMARANTVSRAGLQERLTHLQREGQAIERQRGAIQRTVATHQQSQARITNAVESGVRRQTAAIEGAGKLRETSARARYDRTIARIKGEEQLFARSQAKQAEAVKTSAAALVQKAEARQLATQKAAGFGQAMTGVGIVMTAVGAKGVSAFNSMAESTAEFDRQSRMTLTQLKGVEGGLEDIKAVARTVGSEVGAPFEEMQDTLFTIFTSMKVDIPEAQELLRGFAKEAVAGQAEMQDVARSSIAMMNAFGLSSKDLTRIQDMQFQTVKMGRISYEELSSNIGKAIPAAARAGQEIEQLGAMMAFMTVNGLDAAMASTSAARAMELIVAPNVIKGLEEFGIKVRDNSGELLQINDIIQQLGPRLAEMSGPERAEFLGELFKGSGNRIQARRFFDLALKNFEEFDWHTQQAIDNAGAFERAYGNMSEAGTTQLQLMANQWEVLRTELGEEILPVKLELAKALLRIVHVFRDMDPELRNSILKFAMIATAIMAVVGPIMVMFGILVMAVAQVTAFTGVWTALLLVLGAPIAIVGLVAAAALLIMNWDKVREAISRAWEKTKEFFGGMGVVIASIAALVAGFGARAAKFFAPMIQMVKQWAGSFGGIVTAVKVVFHLFKSNPIVLAVGLAIFAITMLIRHWDKVQPVVQRVWDFIYGIINRVVTWLVNTWNRVFPYLVAAWGGISTAASNAFQTILAVVRSAWRVISGVASIIVSALGTAFSVVARIAGGVGRTLAGAFGGTVRTLGSVFGTIARAIGDAFSVIGSIINRVVNSLAFQAITAQVRAFGSIFVNVVIPAIVLFWDIASTIFQNIAKIILWFSQVVFAVGQIIVGVIVGSIIWALQWLWRNWDSIFDAIVRVVQWWWRTNILPIWNALVTAIRDYIVPAIQFMGRAFIEGFQQIVRGVSAFARMFWEGMQQVGRAAQWMWRTIVQPVINALVIAITQYVIPAVRFFGRAFWEGMQQIARGAQWMWNNVVQPIWRAIQWAINNLVVPAVQWLGRQFEQIWRGMVAVAQWAWHNILQPIWRGIQAFINNVLVPAFNVLERGFTIAWREVVRIAQWAWNTVIRPVWNGIVSFVNDTLIPGVRRFATFWRDMWNGIANGIRSIWQRISGGIATGVNGAIAQVETFLNRIGNGINSLIERINSLPGVNITFRVGTVSLGRVSSQSAPVLSGGQLIRHKGGMIPGRPGQEVPTLTQAGEAVLTGRAVARLGGESVINSLNRGDGPESRKVDLYRKPGTGGFFEDIITGGVGGVLKKAFDSLVKPHLDRAREMLGSGYRIVSQPIGAVVKLAYDSLVTRVKSWFDNLISSGGGGVDAGSQPLGVQRMMGLLRQVFPGLRLISGYRPGAITATGNPSWHGKGRAVDIPPRMDVFEWIRSNYGSKSLELIFSPAGNRQMYRGRNHMYTGVTRAMHFDHIHWAMQNGGKVLRTGRFMLGEAGAELVRTQEGLGMVNRPTIMNLNRGDMVQPLRNNEQAGNVYQYMPYANVTVEDRSDVEVGVKMAEAWFRSREF